MLVLNGLMNVMVVAITGRFELVQLTLLVLLVVVKVVVTYLSDMFSEGLEVEYTVEKRLKSVETWIGLECVKYLGRENELSFDSIITFCIFL